MSNYSQTTDFSAKDSLATGNASKVIKGSDVDTEFNAIATAIASKRDSTSSDIPSGTMMLFVRTAAPNGWTLSSTWDDVVPIIKSSVTNDGNPDTAGNWTVSSTELKMNFPSTAFTVALPNHSHGVGNLVNAFPNYPVTSGTVLDSGVQIYSQHKHNITGNTAAGGSANTTATVTSSNIAPASGTMTNGNWRPAYVEIIACSKD